MSDEDEIAALRLQQQAVIEAKRRLDGELTSLLDNRAVINARVESLESLQPRLHGLSQGARQFSETMQAASSTAERVRSQVRVLDTAQVRLANTTSKVRDIAHLKRCLVDVRTAVSEENYEAAVGFLARYVGMDTEVLGGSDSSEAVLLHETVSELLIAVRRKLNEASRTEDSQGITQYCRLLAQLGEREEALQRLSKHIGWLVTSQSENEIANLDDALKSSKQPAEVTHSHVDALAHVLDNTAAVLEDHSELVAKDFGPRAVVTIIQELQRQCDVQATRIVDRFLRDRLVPKRLRDVQRALSNDRRDGGQGQATSMVSYGVGYIKGSLGQFRSGTPEGRTDDAASAGDASPDPRDLDGLLDEIALVSARSEVFDRHLRVKAAEALERAREIEERDQRNTEASQSVADEPAGTGAAAQKVAAAGKSGAGSRRPAASQRAGVSGDGLAHVSELNRRVQELMGAYLTLEEYYMMRSARKTLALDEAQPDSPISSCIDDMFFILRKCARRSLATRSSDPMCAVINHVNMALSQVLDPYLRERFRILSQAGASASVDHDGSVGGAGGSAGLGTAGAPGGGNVAPSEARYDAVVAVNNMVMAGEYTVKFRIEMDHDVRVILKSSSESARMKVQTCLEDLPDAAQAFQKAAATNILQIFQSSVQPRLRSIVEQFAEVSYNIGDLEYSDYQVNDPFAFGAVAQATKLVQPYKDSFVEKNYATFIGHAAQYIARKVEGLALQKQFTHLGALQFDRDIRAFTAFFTETCPASQVPRAKWARITQIASVLNVDSLAEVSDFWGGFIGEGGSGASSTRASITWRLTPPEVRRILALRVEFEDKDVARLKL